MWGGVGRRRGWRGGRRIWNAFDAGPVDVLSPFFFGDSGAFLVCIVDAFRTLIRDLSLSTVLIAYWADVRPRIQFYPSNLKKKPQQTEGCLLLCRFN